MTSINGTSSRRHCMVVHNYYPLREPRVEREARALIAHGFTVDVLCLRADGEPSSAVHEGVNIIRLPVRRRKGQSPASQLLEYLAFFILASVKLALLHRRRRYATIQVHNLPDFLVFAALLPKLLGARVILDLHDLMPEFYASRFKRGMDSLPVRLLRWQERLCCAFADHVITVTEQWRRTLIERGVPAKKVSVVMNVPDSRIFRSETNGHPAPDRNGHFHLFYHGTLTARYGVDLAIRALDLVRRQLPDVGLTIHGAGEFSEALMQLTGQLGLEHHVRFSTRALPIEDLPGLIRQADVAIVPYRSDIFTDGILPTKLMEYVTLGVPVIASRTPAISAYFDESMVQFFTPGNVEELADCILSLHADRARLAALARNAAAFNRRYSWAAVSAEYAERIERLSMSRRHTQEA